MIRALPSLFLLVICFSAFAQEDARDGRFASLDSDEVNVRAGPGTRYPVEWVFVREAVPVEIIAEYDLWRKIRDQEGDVGWIHRSLLSSKRTSLVTAELANIYPRPGGEGSVPRVSASVQAEQGVILDLVSCLGAWCEVEVADHDGWILRGDIWGVYWNEDFH